MTTAIDANGYTVVIIDDEPLAREGLGAAVARVAQHGLIGEVRVVATCENAFQGLAALRSLRPDIALVDVVMPELDGFEMLEQLEPEDAPAVVIFVTAYDNRAVKAFEVHALDYLVKPVPDVRLRDALQRAVQRIALLRTTAKGMESGDDNEIRNVTYLQQLVIPERSTRLILPVSEIDWIEGDTYYVRVHAGGRQRLLRARMRALEQALDPSVFIRVHRSALVRLSLIRELRQDSPFSFSALLASGHRVPVSKSRRALLEAALNRGKS